jgi:hypothetical protein
MRYEMRKLASGWAAWDTISNAPAIFGNCWQVALPLEDADDLTDLLNQLDDEQKDSTQH